MRPPLLSKREIDVAKSSDRAREIAEGLKLTRKVDGLRELQLETEANYEKFRSETLQTLHKEIESKILVRDTLDSDICTKKAEWDRLLEPLDKNWKRYVEGEKASIEGLKAEWESKHSEVISKLYELSQAEEKTEKEKEIYLEGQTKNAEQYMLARKLRDEAKKLRDEADLTSSVLIEKAERKEKAASKREIDTELKQQNVLLYEQSLKTKEKALEDREMKVLVKELELYSPVKRI